MAVYGYTGYVGAGKTLSAVAKVIGLIDGETCGVLVLSNIRLSFGLPGVYHQQFVLEDGWADDVAMLLYWIGRTGEFGGRPIGYVCILLDECGLMMWSRAWQSFPKSLLWSLSQSRKLRADLVYTAQFVTQVDATMRESTERITVVRCFPTATIARRRKGKRPWLVLHTPYVDPGHVGKAKHAKGLRVFRYRRRFEGLYDTDELVVPPGVGVAARRADFDVMSELARCRLDAL